MSAERWQRSLRQLHATADSLETAVDVAPTPAPPAPTVVLLREIDPRPSTLRALARVAVHSAVTVGVLVGACAVGDPYLPRAERPHLADRVVTVDSASERDPSIPPFEANRP